MSKNKRNKKSLIPWFLARLFCLTHLTITIYLCLVVKFIHNFFFISIIGIALIILETVILSFFKFRSQYSFILLLIYSFCIISSIWLLELYNRRHLMDINDQQASVEVFSVIYYAPIEPENSFFLFNKYLWSQIQMQLYVLVVVILKGLFETKDHRLDIVVRTWTNALDVLDFSELLKQPKLYSDIRFVYTVLSIWSFSCFQFIISMSRIKKIVMETHHPRLASIMTYSLLSIIIIDIPYLIIRLYAIFGVRSHNYTSYFLVSKNIIAITLQTADVWTVFTRDTKKKNNPIGV